MTSLSPRETKDRIRRLELEYQRGFAFSLKEKSTHLAYNWHAHSRHQLLYSLSGRIILQSSSARWLLPPQRAAWIPAGMRHRTTLDRAEIVSVFFKTVPRDLKVGDIRILRAHPLLREMLIYSSRWPAQGRFPAKEMKSQRLFFQSLASLCLDWIRQELPFRLPAPQDERIEKAVVHLLENLDSADMAASARFSGQSIRTLRRRFLPATGMTWQQYRFHARMLHAMDALIESRRSILEIALAVGYESPSAFARAFAQFSGATPLAFRQSSAVRR